ncbi:hypothetical protein HK407_05g09360 [Ordospora pajunii]|uniref:uncharacterized protein n=1 Tax=Ordospora pajunii TaxID=3039483 RepID=UPI0029528575|nr:uncharacterized protein HK407_05g09360 [Ordospora pajunii]KAH9411418.1 hypothetical protein HK407_05g09360 [Ordospora pajunii]
MSRFFESIDEEKEKGGRSEIKEKVYDTDERVGKKEKKLYDLQCKVKELEEESSQKVFDKQLKKMLVDVKKAENCFGGRAPGFLKTFFASARVEKSAHKKAIDELMSKYECSEEPVEEEVNKKIEEKICKDLNSILVIRDGDERQRELEEFKGSTRDETMRTKALMALLSIYVKAGNGTKTLGIMNEILDCFVVDLNANAARAMLLENVDFYLGVIYEKLDVLMFDMYGRLLGRLLLVDRDAVEKRALQFEVFKMHRSVDTANPLFKLVYIVRNGTPEEARKWYLQIKDGIADGKIEQEVLEEYGICLFKNGDFEMSYEVLSKCYPVMSTECRLYVELLCVILNDRIRGSPAHKRFVEEFMEFGENRFCLRSGDSRVEAQRAFYLMNMYDVHGAAEIIRRHCKCFDENSWLRDFVNSRLTGKIAREVSMQMQ